MWYKLEANGSVCEFCSHYIEGLEYTDKAIVIGWNGLMYLEGSEPEKPLELIQVEIQKQLTDTIRRILDKKAQELLYDNCLSVCSYIDTGVQKFDDEGRCFRAWRSAVWAKSYEILAEVVAGSRANPSEEELMAMLPALEISYS